MSAPGTATDVSLFARFRADVAEALGRAPGTADQIALAVSGGADSMAMLALAAGAFPGRVIAATFDHKLRAESAGDAALVSAWCAANNIVHATLSSPQPIAGASLQAQARAARYEALLDWARVEQAAALTTAHHADDAAETFLMRAARGSGLSGLAGIRARQDWAGVAVIRPLLAWRRDELRSFAIAAAIPFIDDPANADPRHDRTRFRALLHDNEWLAPARIARSATMLAEADSELRALIDMLWSERTVPGGGGVNLNIAGLPREPLRRLTRRAIAHVRDENGITSPEWTQATNIEPLLQSLAAGKAATQAGIIVSSAGDIWHFRTAPPRRSL